MRLPLALSILLITFHLSAQNLSTKAEISLLTVEPGIEIYNAFGHSGVRVLDTAQGIDLVYNFGNFTFGEPNFVLKFVQGKLRYWISTGSFERFVKGYIYRNRSVTEQIINLTTKEKQQVFDLLKENSKDENKYYRYDFFFDNCSSRIRDIFEKVLGGKLVLKPGDVDQNLSYRQLLDPYLQNRQWYDLGMDLGLSYHADKTATLRDHMFLPENMMNLFALAQLVDKEQQITPLVKATNSIYESQNKVVPKRGMAPLYIFWIGFALFIMLYAWGTVKGKLMRVPDFLLFFLSGIAGVLLLFFWTSTNHEVTYGNFNLLWALPTNLIIAFIILFKQRGKRLGSYGLIAGILCLATILFAPILPQEIHVALFPVIILLALRNIALFIHYKARSTQE